MQFEWDENKSLRNLEKHKLSFDTAILVFEDPHAISLMNRIVDGEQRWQTLGMAGGIVVILVAYTSPERDGEERIRIISARKAIPRGRKIHEKNL